MPKWRDPKEQRKRVITTVPGGIPQGHSWTSSHARQLRSLKRWCSSTETTPKIILSNQRKRPRSHPEHVLTKDNLALWKPISLRTVLVRITQMNACPLPCTDDVLDYFSNMQFCLFGLCNAPVTFERPKHRDASFPCYHTVYWAAPYLTAVCLSFQKSKSCTEWDIMLP